jgi:predicted transcriptional regulator
VGEDVGVNDASVVIERWLGSLIAPEWVLQVLHSRSGGGPTAIDLVPPAGSTRRLRVQVVSGDVGELHELEVTPDHRDVVVVAQWFSPQACELLRDRELNYVDGTGNVRLALDDPVVLLDRGGSPHEPDDHEDALLRGPKAVRLLRHLLDGGRRSRVKELAATAQMSTGYVSKLLTMLERKGLLTRGRRGRVEEMDVGGLLLLYAELYDTETFADTRVYACGQPVEAVVDQLRDGVVAAVVTGAFGSVRLVPAATPDNLTAYVEDQDAAAARLGLDALEPAHGVGPLVGAVLLRRAHVPFLLDHTWRSDGLTYASVPQLVADCFDAADDAAGQRLLRWSLRHVASWRTPGGIVDEPARLGS